MKLMADQKLTEANIEFNMASTLITLGFDVRLQVVPKEYPDVRFDICIMDGNAIIGVIEMKRHKRDATRHEVEFWKTSQGLRYREICRYYRIPVLYCAGQSEIERVAKEMYKELRGWKAQLKRLFGF